MIEQAAQFATGQRWISTTEPDLGLGTVLDVDFRQITVVFLASGETRRYAKESAPLTRVVFNAGDRISSEAGWQLDIELVEETAGLLRYVGRRSDTQQQDVLEESALDHFLQFRTPRDRLFAGLLDGHRWFELRRRVYRQRHALAHSSVRGLLGARINLLPHQIYIAVQVSGRLAPRALLADEVGLGKTIEAGLIMHRLRVTGRVSRVLIVVPAVLQHQWLAELHRKFNLSFSLFDDTRFAAMLDSAPEGNPFLGEQNVLVALENLLADPAMGQAAVTAGWDQLVVDEAHHLEWSPGAPSAAYRLIESIAHDTASVLLLTATPEQLGQAGHFARLRLLDPDRFDSLDRYLEEEHGFTEIATIASHLADEEPLDESQINRLEALFGNTLNATERNALSSGEALATTDLATELLNALIDRHGTGRLLFRNTRRTVPGFAERRLVRHTLEGSPANEPRDWLTAISDWLITFLSEHPSRKVLLIAASPATVVALGEQLRLAGVASALFHEGLSIVERDRAAAWFADPEQSCRLLMCSEIGSEGRNFQFLHTLVTVELPTSPDMLEQRIGRLDRIGQRHVVEVHVPRMPDSRDDLLLRWYDEGLDAFARICHAGQAIVEQLGARLEQLLDEMASGDMSAHEAGFDTLIDDTRRLASEIDAQLETGRDRLLELNSNRPERVQEHLDELARIDRSFQLQDFMGAVFDRFGVTVEEQNDYWILQPGDNMQMAQFPGLPGDGLSVTFSRQTALAREDFTFLSWDHPMVIAAMDLILDEGYGQADCQVISVESLPSGFSAIEALFVITCTADSALDMGRFLPMEMQTWFIGIDGRDYTAALHRMDLESHRRRYDRTTLKQVVQKNRSTIEPLIDKAKMLAENRLPDIVAQARSAIEREHAEERERLTALARVNPSVTEAEIELLDNRNQARLDALSGAHVRAVGLRLLFNR